MPQTKSKAATPQAIKTLTFEELEEIFAPHLEQEPDSVMGVLLAHLRVQEMRLTAWEEGHKKLVQRFTSLDEEFYDHVEVTHELPDCPQPNFSGQSNSVEFSPAYQESQGFAPPISPATPQNSPNAFDHSDMEITDVQFDDPKRDRAFKSALTSLQVIEPHITEGELIRFIMG
jgi:hypothetical protein